MLLEEVSKKDRLFTQHKLESLRVAAGLANCQSEVAKKIANCCKYLAFGVTADGDLKLRQVMAAGMPLVRFCRQRACPICQWRRSLILKARAKTALTRLLNDYPSPEYAWLFLTLTIKNPRLKQMRSSVRGMQKAWSDMSKPYKKFRSGKSSGNPYWMGRGWFKSLEITAGDIQNSCHPHFHALVLVDASYFSVGSYLDNYAWSDMWSHYLQVSYKARVHVQSVKSVFCKVPEVFKYIVKPGDLQAGSFASAYVSQMPGVRCFDSGGVVRQYFRDVKDDPSDLIHVTDEDKLEETSNTLIFKWDVMDLSHIGSVDLAGYVYSGD